MKNSYLEIVKPGIIIGNLVPFTGSFLLSSKGTVNFFLFFGSLLAISLIIASNCVLNNIIDSDIDREMKRTCNRVLPKNRMSLGSAYYYSLLLGVLGFIYLYFLVDIISVCFCLFATFIYIIIYTKYMKRNSIYAPLVGSLSGSMPALIGYYSVNHTLDLCAVVLFLIFSIWQIPHSYSIYIYRIEEYKCANIPVISLIQGILITKHLIVLSIIVFMYLTIIFYFLGYTGEKYLFICLISELFWLFFAVYGYKVVNNKKWAKFLFILSIVVIFVFNVMIAYDFKKCYK